MASEPVRRTYLPVVFISPNVCSNHTRIYIYQYILCTAVYLFCHRPYRVLRVSGANASDANRHAVDGEVASQYDSVQEAVGVHVLSSDEIEKHFFLRARRT